MDDTIRKAVDTVARRLAERRREKHSVEVEVSPPAEELEPVAKGGGDFLGRFQAAPAPRQVAPGHYLAHLGADTVLDGYVHEGVLHVADVVIGGVSTRESTGARPNLDPVPLVDIRKSLPNAYLEPVGE